MADNDESEVIASPDEETSAASEYMDLSDEEFLKAETPVFEEGKTQPEPDETVTVSTATTDAGIDTKSDTVVDPVTTDKPDAKDPADKAAVATTEETTPEIDYKAEFDKVMTPFQANGTEMKPKSTEDVIRLMQMGANYHKKMAGLKPSMKILKLLENNQLLDPEKINFLIDLNSKNPAAITKLLKESGMDPLDIDTKADTAYTPTSRNVSDTELDLDTVLESIKDTPTYNKTLTIVTKDWDTSSRTAAANAPNTLAIINQHVADGTYEKVMGAVQYERSMGNLRGVSDLEAYKAMGDQLWNQGILGTPTTQTVTIPAKVELVKPKTAPVTDAKRQAQKKAASPTVTGKSAATPNFNPLSMSDEEIAKFDERQLKAFA